MEEKIKYCDELQAVSWGIIISSLCVPSTTKIGTSCPQEERPTTEGPIQVREIRKRCCTVWPRKKAGLDELLLSPTLPLLISPVCDGPFRATLPYTKRVDNIKNNGNARDGPETLTPGYEMESKQAIDLTP
ncbi:hypothetical protein KQX54_003926 [Cotesia glomerata]|uniref:Uncharacterized protein n=1 Tax=Cotesia glomerata TaxID=32391 RepID=A0AAV7IUF8_COTGL|nr:hypothetical protein KQX54_003926 [Cotesia glomerata]